VSLWHGDSAVCPSRIFIGTLVGEMYALDAMTGYPCEDFGDQGRVDLSIGVGDVDIGDYSITSPPAVIGDQIIVGSAIGDNRAVRSERGIVRAMDAKSGEIRWVWDPIPRSEADPAHETWEGESAAITGCRQTPGLRCPSTRPGIWFLCQLPRQAPTSTVVSDWGTIATPTRWLP